MIEVPIRDVVEGMSWFTGRVIVFDGDQLARRPPVTLARAFVVPFDRVYASLESVLLLNQLGCIPVTLRVSGIETVDIVHVVNRPETRGGPVAEPEDPFARREPWKLVVVGPEELAAKVRRALEARKP